MNQLTWPGQILLYILAVVAVGLAIRQRTEYSDRLIVVILAFFWLWTAVLYWFPIFAPVGSSGYLLGALFVVQVGVFLYLGIWRDSLQFGFERDMYAWAGGLMVVYALIGYPVVGQLIGHTWPALPLLGQPCPITVFTFGMLLMTVLRVPKIVLVIPLIFGGFFGIFPPLNYGILEDVGLVLASFAGTILLVYRDSRVSAPSPRSSVGA